MADKPTNEEIITAIKEAITGARNDIRASRHDDDVTTNGPDTELLRPLQRNAIALVGRGESETALEIAGIINNDTDWKSPASRETAISLNSQAVAKLQENYRDSIVATIEEGYGDDLQGGDLTKLEALQAKMDGMGLKELADLENRITNAATFDKSEIAAYGDGLDEQVQSNLRAAMTLEINPPGDFNWAQERQDAYDIALEELKSGADIAGAIEATADERGVDATRIQLPNNLDKLSNEDLAAMIADDAANASVDPLGQVTPLDSPTISSTKADNIARS